MTVGGQQQARNLGQWLRNRYVDQFAFLPDAYRVSLERRGTCGIADSLTQFSTRLLAQSVCNVCKRIGALAGLKQILLDACACEWILLTAGETSFDGYNIFG